ncbi:hypothetical protein [Flavobacterium sp. H122]|uniref:hypothetical protein n=1 Tax=Flavobacterium sp. H122 TaxID=2529860 RepID=UPI0010AB4322|nr:hypothetical protein [Flavobacterium sp. H122]
MLKNILNLEGAHQLSKNEQKSIQGGRIRCKIGGVCTQYGIQCAETDCMLVDLCVADPSAC